MISRLEITSTSIKKRFIFNPNVLREHNIATPYPRVVLERRAEKGLVTFAQTDSSNLKRAFRANSG